MPAEPSADKLEHRTIVDSTGVDTFAFVGAWAGCGLGWRWREIWKMYVAILCTCSKSAAGFCCMLRAGDANRVPTGPQDRSSFGSSEFREAHATLKITLEQCPVARETVVRKLALHCASRGRAGDAVDDRFGSRFFGLPSWKFQRRSPPVLYCCLKFLQATVTERVAALEGARLPFLRVKALLAPWALV